MADQAQALRTIINVARILDRRPRPRCRDCADEDGTCPNSGLPCDMDAAFQAAERALAALSADQLRQAVQEEQAVSVRLRELLLRAQTYVCLSDLEGVGDLSSDIAEALIATKHLCAAAIRSGEGEKKE